MDNNFRRVSTFTYNYNDYTTDFTRFCKEHGCLDTVHTSSMENNGYHKEYIFKDGAIFHEICQKVVEKVEVIVHNVLVPATVTLFRTDWFSSDDFRSKFYYETF